MKKKKLYGLFTYDTNGFLVGFVENSFSMSWRKDRVCVFSSQSAEYYLKKYVKQGAFIVRLTKQNKSIPIKVFIKEWAGQHKPPYGKKFDRRNIRFALIKQKDHNGKTPDSSTVSQETK
jgi:hypothetical protein